MKRERGYKHHEHRKRERQHDTKALLKIKSWNFGIRWTNEKLSTVKFSSFIQEDHVVMNLFILITIFIRLGFYYNLKSLS